MYQAPVDDMKFVLRHLIGLESVAAMDGMDMVSEDLVEAVLEEAGKLAGEVIAPLNHAGDMAGAVRNDDGTVTTPAGFADRLGGDGGGRWIGLNASPDYGGQGCRNASVRRERDVEQRQYGVCAGQLLTQGAIHALEVVGDDAQKATYLPKLNAGEWTGTMNLTEPQAGTDLAALRTTATPEGDHYRIRGQKIYITYGEHDMSENIIHLVLARLPDAPPGVKGISLFIVPKFLVNEDGSLGGRNDVHACRSRRSSASRRRRQRCFNTVRTRGRRYLLGEEESWPRLHVPDDEQRQI